MEATAILLDRENREIKIYFGHTNYCVHAPLTWQNYSLYCYFNNIKGPELEIIELKPFTVDEKQRLDNINFSELISL
jgi:hypothetical protein